MEVEFFNANAAVKCGVNQSGGKWWLWFYVNGSSPATQCDGINGSGIISGGGSTLKVSFDSTAKGCATESTAPSVVNITGNAVITGGTGKFAGATGTFKVTGSFAIKSTAAGTNESSALTLTLAGNINTK